MEIPKVEVYKVKNWKLSIEEYENRKKGRFFPSLPHKRYRCWCNSGRLGKANTLEEARQILFEFVADRLEESIKKFAYELYTCLDAQQTLDDNANNLQKFKVAKVGDK